MTCQSIRPRRCQGTSLHFKHSRLSILITPLSLREQEPVVQVKRAEAQTTLWVDRYRPQRYLDLLGDDRIHREVMSWVKEWDYCVYGKKKGKKRARGEENLDEYRRPREKVS